VERALIKSLWVSSFFVSATSDGENNNTKTKIKKRERDHACLWNDWTIILETGQPAALHFGIGLNKLLLPEPDDANTKKTPKRFFAPLLFSWWATGGGFLAKDNWNQSRQLFIIFSSASCVTRTLFIYFFVCFPPQPKKSRTSSAVIKRKHQRTSDESAKDRRHFLGWMCKRHVQLPRQVVKKTLARQRNARNNTLLWCVYKMLRHLGQKWSNKHRTIVHPPLPKKDGKIEKGVLLTLCSCVYFIFHNTQTSTWSIAGASYIH
jgi:hypothetical protein